ncbi:antibiotic biosynthesis monooxygenase [Nocardioides sp. SYSU D00038]|uniref:antibiotic biosynthesis monooxygenase family protein n=1 Tax=Nocardioides sp. SYSU D00038 TaxID=2812554 RepID=UPI0019678178|nr:antibiotic biosynthesis monooxygenase [Nocardioides sp. SYSU D00038]
MSDPAAARSAPVLEHALLQVRPGREDEFAAAFAQARELIAASEGFLFVEVRRCLEQPSLFLLLVGWTSVEAHEQGFRGSERYEEWRRLLHHFYDPFPVVQHFAPVI